MKFTAQQSDLKNAISTVSGALEKSRGIPILSNIMLVAEGASITVMATDIDVTIRTSFETAIQEEGALLIEGRRFESIVGFMRGEIDFTTDAKQWATIKAGGSRFRVPTLPADNFPKPPEVVPDEKARIDAEALAALIRTTSPAVASDENGIKFTLGVHRLEISDGKADMVATDTYRVALARATPWAGLAGLTVSIPRRGAQQAMNLRGDVSISEDSSHVFLTTDDVFMMCRKVVGDYPDCRSALPTDTDHYAEFKAADMKQAIIGASLLIDDDKNYSVALAFDKDSITVGSVTTESGEASATVECKYDGEPATLGFRPKQILDFFNVIDSDVTVLMKWLGDDSRIMFGIVGDETYEYMLVKTRPEVQERTREAKKAKAGVA